MAARDNPLEELLTSDVEDNKQLIDFLTIATPTTATPTLGASYSITRHDNHGNGTSMCSSSVSGGPGHTEAMGLVVPTPAQASVTTFNHISDGQHYANHIIARQQSTPTQQHQGGINNNISDSITATLTNANTHDFTNRTMQLQQAQSLANTILTLKPETENGVVPPNVVSIGPRGPVTITNRLPISVVGGTGTVNNVNCIASTPASAGALIVNYQPRQLVRTNLVGKPTVGSVGVLNQPRSVPVQAIAARSMSPSTTAARLQQITASNAQLFATLSQRIAVSSPSLAANATTAALMRPINQTVVGEGSRSSAALVNQTVQLGSSVAPRGITNITSAGNFIVHSGLLQSGQLQQVRILNTTVPPGSISNVPSGIIRIASTTAPLPVGAVASAPNVRTLAQRMVVTSTVGPAATQQLTGVVANVPRQLVQSQSVHQQPQLSMQVVRTTGATPQNFVLPQNFPPGMFVIRDQQGNIQGMIPHAQAQALRLQSLQTLRPVVSSMGTAMGLQVTSPAVTTMAGSPQQQQHAQFLQQQQQRLQQPQNVRIPISAAIQGLPVNQTRSSVVPNNMPPPQHGTAVVASTNIRIQAVDSVLAAGSTAQLPVVLSNAASAAAPVAAQPQKEIQQPHATNNEHQTAAEATAQTKDMLDNVKKCKNFLSTLLKLAAGQPANTVAKVRTLIQGLIDGNVEPEGFTTQLQKELQSSPQPYLVPFLKKSLPFLRHSLAVNRMHIEGIKPPQPGSPAALLLAKMSINAVISALSKQQQNSAPHLLVQPQGVNRTSVSPAAPAIPTQITTQAIAQAQRLVMQERIRKATDAAAAAKLASAASAAATAAKTLHTQAIPHTAVTAGNIVSRTNFTAVHGLTVAATTATPGMTMSHKAEKRKYDALRDDDDINDVATMGGVNLSEETNNILATNSGLVSGQLRSCKDERFLDTTILLARINDIALRHGLAPCAAQEVAHIVSHASQERLRTIVEKLSVITEHRLEMYKTDARFEVTNEVKVQIKFLEELDSLERKRHEEVERGVLMKAAKSRSKLEDPEQAKLKEKAKAIQAAEMEELRQKEANLTALAAIGPRKPRRLDTSGASGSQTIGGVNNDNAAPSINKSSGPLRPRIKRVTLRDLLFALEQEREFGRSPLLFKAFLK